MDLKNSNAVEKSKYWNLNLVSGANLGNRPLDEFYYVRIFFSHAYNQRIPIEANRMHLDVIPYYRPTTGIGYFNFDWIELRKILYSFTEDHNGSGRLGRIRVQTNLSLNGDFSAFDVAVEGYQVDHTVFQRGYRMVSDATQKGAFDDDSFYIYLVENSEIDGGNTPLWSVTRNESLEDSLTGTLVGDPEIDVNMKPFDTIPPRIAYTLTLPGHPQTYVRMSEPVLSGIFSGGLIDYHPIEITAPKQFIWQYFPFESNEITSDYKETLPAANLAYLLQWNNPFTISDLALLKNLFGDTSSSSDTGYFQADNMIDQARRALDWSDHKLDHVFYIYYQPPKYPLNWGYTEYAKVYGNEHIVNEDFSDDEPLAATAEGTIEIERVFLPPNRMLTVEMMTEIARGNGKDVIPQSFTASSSSGSVIRRVTDSLVSIPPGNTNSSDYFAWPVWARYQDEPNMDGYTNNSDFWGQINTDTGIIWEFDGTKYLEANIIDMQARINSILTGNLSLQLFWTTNVPVEFRIPKEAPQRGRSSGGLWLPYPGDLHNNRLLYYYAPLFKDSGRIGELSAFSNNYPLVNFKISEDTPPGFTSGNKIEFVFRIVNNASPVMSDMFVSRLDIPRGGAIPDNWYNLVKPFSFDIQNIRLQRGGVTVLNNVINSDNREVCYIRYNLVRPGRVTIQVYTLDGTLVKSLRRNEYRGTGEYTDAWDGTNNGGRPVARGMYFVRVVGPDIDEIRKIMVVR